MGRFYLASLDHMVLDDPAILFWRINRIGYTYELNLAQLYSEEEAKKLCELSHLIVVAIPENLAEELSKKWVVDCRRIAKIVENTEYTRKALGLDPANFRSMRTLWGAVRFETLWGYLERNRGVRKFYDEVEAELNPRPKERVYTESEIRRALEQYDELCDHGGCNNEICCDYSYEQTGSALGWSGFSDLLVREATPRELKEMKGGS